MGTLPVVSKRLFIAVGGIFKNFLSYGLSLLHWYSTSSCQPKTQLMEEKELEGRIKKEAERVFRHLAIDYITKNDPEADISQTYK